MGEILREVGGLVLGSVPTAILFLLLIPCYTLLMHRPLARVLAERRRRTEGAVEKAETAAAIADAKAQEYEARLRAARVEIQQEREKQVAGWNAAREQALGEAREAAAARVRQARHAVEAEAARSRESLEGSIDGLANEILAAVLPGAPKSTQAGSQ